MSNPAGRILRGLAAFISKFVHAPSGDLFLAGELDENDDPVDDTGIVIPGPKGSAFAVRVLSEEVTIPVGSGNDPVVTTTMEVPADSFVLGVAGRVTLAPGGGAAALDVGRTGGATDEFADGVSCDVLGEDFDSFEDASPAGFLANATAATLTLTTDSDVTTSAMKVRLVLWYATIDKMISA